MCSNDCYNARRHLPNGWCTSTVYHELQTLIHWPRLIGITVCRELLYLDLALENTVRAAAERGSGASGTGAAALMAPLLQNLVLSAGDNEELAYCLKAWQALPDTVKTGRYPAKDDALKVCLMP